MDPLAILGSAFGLAFVSGIRLYATVFAIGLSVRLQWFELPEHLAGLNIFASTPVLVIAGTMYTAEFVADKIPLFDTLWDVIHTFVRPIGAAILVAMAIGTGDPVVQLGASLIAGGVAFSSHATKASTRLAVNHSPEPLSNVGLSLTEDVAAVGAIWFVLHYPVATLAIVIVLVTGIAWLLPRLARTLWRQAERPRHFLASCVRRGSST